MNSGDANVAAIAEVTAKKSIDGRSRENSDLGESDCVLNASKRERCKRDSSRMYSKHELK